MLRTERFTHTVSSGRVSNAIAAAAHVTRRTFYYHLDSKDSLLAAVLADQNDLALARIRRWTEKARGEPEQIVAILFTELEA